ncbi:hypothetical protein G6F57_020452 [Rhizopus arrhizus]|nr:hypothetical protein G6F22_014884 [Rhizopus arrhizus]KAG1385541.1 hypothetical protein G6F59_017342 [Rhizopus arrhizus]KAG1436953.1 hypothetical protein G6F57_020452 [Rhizopus arrhizus]
MWRPREAAARAQQQHDDQCNGQQHALVTQAVRDQLADQGSDGGGPRQHRAQCHEITRQGVAGQTVAQQRLRRDRARRQSGRLDETAEQQGFETRRRQRA